MDSFDLDIQNYNLQDILNLFKLSHNFDSNDLKQAYKVYLMTHPDKSGLSDDIFLFFGKAYKTLKNIYEFRNRKQKEFKKYQTVNLERENEQLLEKLNGKSVKDFNKWFNEMFEKVRVNDENSDSGYGDWYKDYKDKDVKKVSMGQFQDAFEKEKQTKDIIVRNEILEVDLGNGYTLDRNTPENYSSGIFSKLNFEDLKKAHTETTIPVSQKDFENKQKFNTLEQYKHHRNSVNTKPLSLQQSKNYLNEKQNKTTEQDNQRIYSILKQDEEYEKSNKRWWGYLKQLE